MSCSQLPLFPGTAGNTEHSRKRRGCSAVPVVPAVFPEQPSRAVPCSRPLRGGTGEQTRDPELWRVIKPGTAFWDVLRLPAELFGALPLSSTLVLDLPGSPARLAVSSSQAVLRAARRAGRVAFDIRELVALTCAAEHGRASQCDLLVWCTWKLHAWRLDLSTAMSGVCEFDPPRHWTLGRVLGWYGCVLVSVGTGDEVR
jgi:hypothetical protein